VASKRACSRYGISGFVEETEVDIVAVIPAHLKEFQSVDVVFVTASELCAMTAGERQREHHQCNGDESLLPNEETQEPGLVALCDKAATLEYVFYLPNDEFTRPFVPTDALNPPKQRHSRRRVSRSCHRSAC
jgi:hypothetical protein